MKHREPSIACLSEQHGKWTTYESTLVQGHALIRRLVCHDKELAERVVLNWRNNDYSIPGSVDHAAHEWKIENCGK